MTDLQSLVADIHAQLAPRAGEGHVTNYIPALARVDPTRLGIAAVDLDGRVAAAGDAHVSFSIQLAMSHSGPTVVS